MANLLATCATKLTVAGTTAAPEQLMVCGSGRFVASGGTPTLYFGTSNGSVDIILQRTANQDFKIATYSGGSNTALRILGTCVYACTCLQSPTLCATSKTYYGSTSTAYIHSNGDYLRHTNAHGYIQFGPENSSWAHIITDRNCFYFNCPITVNGGVVTSYDENLVLACASGSTQRIVITNGTTTSCQKMCVFTCLQSPVIASTSQKWSSSDMKIQNFWVCSGNDSFSFGQGGTLFDFWISDSSISHQPRSVLRVYNQGNCIILGKGCNSNDNATIPVYACNCVHSPVICATSCIATKGAGAQSVWIGSTDNLASLLLDGSDGDFSGSDYAWIRHDNNKVLFIENDQAASHICIWNRSNNAICFGTNNSGRLVIHNGGTVQACHNLCSNQSVVGCVCVSSPIVCGTNYVKAPSLVLTSDVSGDMKNGIALGCTGGLPQAAWGESGTQTGRIEIGLPTLNGEGQSNHYGMVHVAVDVYEYNGNDVMTFIVGGHNWQCRWYNCGAHITGGCTDKTIKVAYHTCGGSGCNGRYVILLGEPGSSWTYGSVHVRSITNGLYYSNAMNMCTPWYVKRVTCADSHYNQTSPDLRSSSNSMAGYQCAMTCVHTPRICATTCVKSANVCATTLLCSAACVLVHTCVHAGTAICAVTHGSIHTAGNLCCGLAVGQAYVNEGGWHNQINSYGANHNIVRIKKNAGDTADNAQCLSLWVHDNHAATIQSTGNLLLKAGSAMSMCLKSGLACTPILCATNRVNTPYVCINGQAEVRPFSTDGARGIQLRGGCTSTVSALELTNNAGTWMGTMYSTGSAIGWLDASWGNWDVKKNINGTMCVTVGSSGFICALEGGVCATTCVSAPRVCATNDLISPLVYPTGCLQFDQPGTRSWKVCASGGNLNFHSGDGSGAFCYHSQVHSNYLHSTSYVWGSSCLCSPIVCATGSMKAPVVCGTGCLASHIIRSGANNMCLCPSGCGYGIYFGPSDIGEKQHWITTLFTASGTQARRAKLLEFSYNTHHWDSGGAIIIETFLNYYGKGSSQKWQITQTGVDGTASGSQNCSAGADLPAGARDVRLMLLESNGGDTNYYKIHVDMHAAGFKVSDYDVGIAEVYLDVDNYAQVAAKATLHGSWTNINTGSSFTNSSQYKFYNTASYTNISTFYNSPPTVPGVAGRSLYADKIWGSANWQACCQTCYTNVCSRYLCLMGSSCIQCLNAYGLICTGGVVCANSCLQSPNICFTNCLKATGGCVKVPIIEGRYSDANTTYRGGLCWSSIQLGNNGVNRIVAGNTSTGGFLDICTNNAVDVLGGGTANGWHVARFCSDGMAKFYYQNAEKFETYTNGIKVCNSSHSTCIYPSASWSHFYSTATKYYFDHEIHVNSGVISSYDEPLKLATCGTVRAQVCEACFCSSNIICAATCMKSHTVCVTCCLKVCGGGCFCGRPSFNANNTSNYDDMATATGSQGAFEVYNNGAGNDSFFAFHSGGDFATYFGLDADTNRISTGGWSAGAVKYPLVCEVNGCISATKICGTHYGDGSNLTGISGGSGVSGSGTDQYVPRFNGTGAVENSAIYSNDSNDVGIGTTSPSYKLHVVGNPLAVQDAIATIRLIGTVNGALIDLKSDSGIFKVRDVNSGSEMYHIKHGSSGYHKWYVNDSLKMALCSNGILYACSSVCVGNTLYANGGSYWSNSCLCLSVPLRSTCICSTGGINADGYVYKGGGGFLIKHPNPAKCSTHTLMHGFVESNTRGDNIYRWQVETSNCTNVITLPEYNEYLNENEMTWVSPVNHFGRAYGEVTADRRCIVLCSDTDGKYNVMLVGTRKDPFPEDGWIKHGCAAERSGSIEDYRDNVI